MWFDLTVLLVFLQIPDDPLRTRAVILQLRCMGRLTWLSDHPDVSVEEYNLTHNSIISALDSLKRDRRQHASEKARIALEAQIGQILQFVRVREKSVVVHCLGSSLNCFL